MVSPGDRAVWVSVCVDTRCVAAPLGEICLVTTQAQAEALAACVRAGVCGAGGHQVTGWMDMCWRQPVDEGARMFRGSTWL